MEPITVLVSGIGLTGALVASAWKMVHRASERKEYRGANVLPLHPKIAHGFSCGRTQHPKDILIRALQEAEQSLDIAICALTDLDILLEIVKAHRRGVEVQIITDTNQFNTDKCQQRMVSELVSEGIPVKMNIQSEATMHLKVTVVDNKMVTVGSFNFTTTSVSKHEEVLVRIDDVATARDWHGHFNYMWNDRKRYALYKQAVQKRDA